MKLRLFLLILFIPCCLWAADETFTVVIDPGHGGKDPGAVGKICYEKNIVLSVGKKVNALLKEKDRSIKVVMTRDNDTFVELERRAQIANNAKANLFVSIHADAVENRSVHGAGTFTMGMSKEKSNMEVAKRENSVISLEDNYQERYLGFDPKSVESYIIFELMQDVYMENSIRLAQLVQNNFIGAKRLDRGVRQAPYWVLHRTGMPAILVELGFITNVEEEKYLKSEKGQDQLAGCLANAILSYKKEIDSRSVSVRQMGEELKAASEKETQAAAGNPNTKEDGLEFRVQIFASQEIVPVGDSRLKGLDEGIGHYRDGKLYKYTYGHFASEKEAADARALIRSKFPDAFVVAMKGENRISLDEARKLLP